MFGEDLRGEAKLVAEQNGRQNKQSVFSNLMRLKTHFAAEESLPSAGNGEPLCRTVQSSSFGQRKKATIQKCSFCGIVVKHPSKINAHMRTHTGEKPFKCSICPQSFTQPTPLTLHIRRHMNFRPFACSFGCGKNYVSNYLKTAHELKVHGGESDGGEKLNSYVKPQKGSTITQTDFKIDSSGTKKPKIFPAEQEEKLPISPESSRRMDEVINAVAAGLSSGSPRKRSRKPSASIAKCKECNLILKHPSKIKAHIRTHTGERPYECKICHLRFASPTPLRVHYQRLHTDEKPYNCSWQCGKRFVTASTRNEHERTVHDKLKRYLCKIDGCNKSFNRRHHYMAHQKKEHNALVESTLDKSSASNLATTCESQSISDCGMWSPGVSIDVCNDYCINFDASVLHDYSTIIDPDHDHMLCENQARNSPNLIDTRDMDFLDLDAGLVPSDRSPSLNF